MTCCNSRKNYALSGLALRGRLKMGLARLGPVCFQRAFNTISLHGVVVGESVVTPETKTHQKNLNIIHTCNAPLSHNGR